MIKYSTSPIDETYTRMHIFLKSHFFYTNRPTVRSTQRNRKRFENTPQNGWRPGPDDSGEKMCKKTNSLWEECSRNQQQRKKWIGALIGLKVNILMLNRLKLFLMKYSFFLLTSKSPLVYFKSLEVIFLFQLLPGAAVDSQNSHPPG